MVKVRDSFCVRRTRACRSFGILNARQVWWVKIQYIIIANEQSPPRKRGVAGMSCVCLRFPPQGASVQETEKALEVLQVDCLSSQMEMDPPSVDSTGD